MEPKHHPVIELTNDDDEEEREFDVNTRTVDNEDSMTKSNFNSPTSMMDQLGEGLSITK